MARTASNKPADSTANLGFEAKLWLAADKLRNNMDAAEYKHVVLGLIFPGAGLKIAWGPAARGFGRGQGGEAGASPQRAVTAEPTPATGKRPAARRGFGEKAGWLRCSSVGDRCGYPPSSRLAIQPFPRKQDSHGISRPAPEYISDTFEEHRAKLLAGEGDYAGANPEDPDEYKAENVFWVPADARWSHLQANAKQPTIGKIVDDAMVAIERDNPRLKGVLPKDYARPGLDKHRLGELIDLIGTIALLDPAGSSGRESAHASPGKDQSRLTSAATGAEKKTHRSVDLLGRVYEYFLTRFASAEGKNGGQFYTPSCVVRCLVEMLAPYTALRGSAFLQSEASPQVVSAAKDNGRIYDPACGSGGMFALRSLPGGFAGKWMCAHAHRSVQSEKFVESHGGSAKPISEASPREFRGAKHHRGDISIYGQESNATTRRLAVMNLALRGIEADFGPEHADTFRRDLYPDLRADTATRASAKPRPRSHSAGLLRSERQLPPTRPSTTPTGSST